MIYDYNITTGKGEQLDLSDYKGKVILVVNTATGCGFTPQYAPLNSSTETITIRGWRSWIFPATSSAVRPPARTRRSMNSAPCTSTLPSRR